MNKLSPLPALVLTLLLAGCGGGGSDAGDPGGPGAGGLPALPSRQASVATPVAAGCTGGSISGTNYANAEVEPFAAAHPLNPNQLLAAWQQDRWSNGGARALVTAVSSDGGATWQRSLIPMSRCGGAIAGSVGDYERATDPWVDFGPDGTAHLMGLAFSGGSFTPGAVSAMLASRSTDGGRSWSTPITLVRDGEAFFNDKNAITADTTDARFVYAVWDRLDRAGRGPALLARSTDAGLSWEPAREFYIPTSLGISQTVGNRVVVIAAGPERGVLVNVFTQIDTVSGTSVSRVGIVRSIDKGVTWQAPVFVADLRAVGARDAGSGKAIRDGSILPTIAAAPDGGLWVAWQDGRFSDGMVDAIALSRSTDGGRSWTAPLAINKVATTPAFTPTLHVRADGLVGVLHYDLRSNTADTTTLLADAWLLTSRDGLSWTETRVHGPFDMNAAPDAGGLFLGDYQGLVSAGNAFRPLLVMSRTDTNNRTDVFSPQVDVVAAARADPLASHRARAIDAAPLGRARAQQFSAATHAAVVRAMEHRVPGWAARVRAASP